MLAQVVGRIEKAVGHQVADAQEQLGVGHPADIFEGGAPPQAVIALIQGAVFAVKISRRSGGFGIPAQRWLEQVEYAASLHMPGFAAGDILIPEL